MKKATFHSDTPEGIAEQQRIRKEAERRVAEEKDEIEKMERGDPGQRVGEEEVEPPVITALRKLVETGDIAAALAEEEEILMKWDEGRRAAKQKLAEERPDRCNKKDLAGDPVAEAEEVEMIDATDADGPHQP